MEPEVQLLRRQGAIVALVPLFVLSGATSLVYETLWERQLHLVVGTSQLSVIITLAAFMAGLAAGGFVSGKYADKVRRPLLVYGLLEGAIGLYALLFPVLIGMVEPIYHGFFQALHPTPALFAAFQFVLLGLFLLPPTMCMGATLPLLARFAVVAREQTGRSVGRLYGANTIGAVMGVGLAGFVLLPQLGLATTTWVTAGGNAVLCLLALGLGFRAGEMPLPAKVGDAAASDPPPRWLATLSLLAFLAGLSSLIYEVSWFRLMVLTLGGSAYAFSTMLLAFLLGIGIGGWASGRLADRAWRKGGAAGVFRVIVGLQAAVAVVAWGLMFAYDDLPVAFVNMYAFIEGAPELLWPGKLVVALGLMLPPAVLMGASFPVLVRAAVQSDALGGPVGRLYGWNTVGAILGAAVGGLVVLPLYHVQGAVVTAVSINLVAALLAARGAAMAGGRLPKPPVQAMWAVGAVAVLGLLHWKKPPWDSLVMTAGMYKYVSDLPPERWNREGVMSYAVEPYELLFYEEGMSSVVTVARSKKTGNIWLANNGKVDASTRVDMPTQVMVAHLPFVFARGTDRVAMVGLASGISAGSVLLHSDIGSFDLIELEPAIVEASHFFDEFNNLPLDDPRTTLIANDARNHFILQPDGTYDVIVSEPSNPWLSGVSNLFTREFFELGKRKLKSGGVWSQWVQMYGMDPDDLRTLLRTFTETYRYVLLFSTIEDADLVLIGSDQPLELTADSVDAMMRKDEAVALDLEKINCATAEDVLTRFQLDQERILELVGDARLNTDDNMLIEYSAPLHLHEDTADANFLMLLEDGEARSNVPLHTVDGVEGRLDLAEAYARRSDWLKALLVLKDADRLEPDNEVVFERYLDYQAELMNKMAEEEAAPKK
jgi:spermidine synthase